MDVLIVDDDPAVARTTQRQLRQQHDVRVAFDVAGAKAEIAKRVPEVLVCDYAMEPENGDVLLRWVRAHHPSVRCVLYTGSDARLLAGLAQAVLSKPASAEALIAVIEGA